MSGAGETNLEIDRRIISDKEKMIKKELSLIKKRRQTSNNKSNNKIVSFVGYTNVSNFFCFFNFYSFLFYFYFDFIYFFIFLFLF